MKVLDLDNVSYSYPDGTRALEGICLEVEKGERVAIIGPNGGGKTTLLKLMAGLLAPSGGSITVLGLEPGSRGSNIIGRVGMVFQDPDDQLFMPSVGEDIAFGPRNLGLDEEEVRSRVEDALAAMGLAGYGDRIPHHLSYGEKKRVALAGILAMEPGILLLDEPTANLDPRGRRDLMGYLEKLDRTLILATHDMSAAAALADRVCVLNSRVLGAGPVRDIMTNLELLESAGLEPPDIIALFLELKRRGRDFPRIPLDISEALESLDDS